MRTTTAGEQTVLTGAAFRVMHRISVKNGSGTWKDLTALGAPGVSYVIEAEIDHDIDHPVSMATVKLRRDEGALSLSPLREDSTLNRLDNGITYSPLVDAGRALKIEIAQIAYGTNPVAGDWKNLFEGVIDAVEFGTSILKVTARDEGGRIVDQYATLPATFNRTSSPTPLQDLIQEILDREFGASVVVLFTPASPGYSVKTFAHDRESVMEILQRLVQTSVQWDLRYRWHEASTSHRLTLKNPDRSKTTPDATFGPGMYVDAKQLEIDRSQVRNRIEVVAGPSTARVTGTADDATSQARFGFRRLHIEESDISPITTLSEANAMAANLLSDLALPKAELEVEMLFYWPIELHDLVRFSDNSVHFNTNQDLAVVGYRHRISDKHRTFLRVRGKPAGAYRAWQPVSFPDPTPDRAAPTASITLKTRYSHQEIVTLDGLLGAQDTGPLEWRYKPVTGVAGGPFSAWSTLSFPRDVSFIRPNYYGYNVTLEVRQSDLQVGRAGYAIPPRITSLPDPVEREKEARISTGGLPKRRGRIMVEDVYDDTGATPLVDTLVGKVTPDLLSADGKPNIISRILTRRYAGNNAGAAAEGIAAQGVRRAGFGGMFHRSQFIQAKPLYSSDGATVLIDTATKKTTADLLDPFDDPVRGGAPVMDIRAVPGTTSYTINYTVTADTFEYSTDGGSYVSVPASGFTVSRNAFNAADKTLTFKATKGDQTISVEIPIPAQILGTISISISTVTFSDTNNTLDVSWSTTGMPTGTKFNVSYKQDGSNGTAGDAQDVTSTYQFTGVTGTTASGLVTVTAEKDGVVICAKTKGGLWTT